MDLIRDLFKELPELFFGCGYSKIGDKCGNVGLGTQFGVVKGLLMFMKRKHDE
jgi:hypothetical protein